MNAWLPRDQRKEKASIMITEDIIKNNEQIRTYITKADEALEL